LTLDVAFIVLHYKALQDTVLCVESILSSQEPDYYRIVIVDNGSGDGSDAVLRDKFGNHPKVELVVSDTNLGFARGMNLGVSWLQADGWNGFAVLLNNDTILSQPGWTALINQKYEQYRFGALGPDIMDLDGGHRNPFYHIPMTRASITKEIWRMRFSIFIHFFLHNLSFSRGRAVAQTAERPQSTTADDVVGCSLQGSCLILSPGYLETYHGLFPGTFLYYEEAALRLLCDRQNLPMVYSPALQIQHTGGVATARENVVQYKREQFARRQSVQSLCAIKRDLF